MTMSVDCPDNVTQSVEVSHKFPYIIMFDNMITGLGALSLYLIVSDTAGPLSYPEFGGSHTGGLWCSLDLPSASAACGSGCPPAPAPSESTSPCRLSCRTTLTARYISNMRMFYSFSVLNEFDIQFCNTLI